MPLGGLVACLVTRSGEQRWQPILVRDDKRNAYAKSATQIGFMRSPFFSLKEVTDSQRSLVTDPVAPESPRTTIARRLSAITSSTKPSIRVGTSSA
jgi:hypothetical protein